VKISSTIDIKSTPDVVFGWLGTPEKAMAWMTSVSKTEILHQTADMVGTRFREVLGGDGGEMEMLGVITGYVPDKSISFHLDSRVNIVDVEYCLEETDAGVRVVEDATVRWKFPLNVLSFLMGRKMRAGIMSQIEAEFQALKVICENGLTT
jgi:uncharacterized protein YndB with AHSA1/START domain